MNPATSPRLPLDQRPAWKALQTHSAEIKDRQLRELFAADPAAACDSPQRQPASSSTTRSTASPTRPSNFCWPWRSSRGLQPKDRGDVPRRQDQHHRGPRRAPRRIACAAGPHFWWTARTSFPSVHAVLDRMAAFSDRVRTGAWKGHTGKRIRNVINIGIGGSDLGPVMAYEALRHYSHATSTFRFVSNVDATDFVEATRDLDPDETLFIVSSKTFTTLETMTNAHIGAGLVAGGAGGDETAVARHFVAVSTNAEEVAKFGIDTGNMFGFWDWVGGRYSMDSAIGLSTMIAIGPEHSATCSPDSTRWTSTSAPRPSRGTCPCCWACSPSGTATSSARRRVAVLPYEQYLKRFPAYLQQLTMESNGKHVTLTASAVTTRPGPCSGASRAPTGSTRFYQLIHQGTELIPCDFIAFSAQPAGRSPRPAHGQRLRADRGARLRQDRDQVRRREHPPGWCRTASSRAIGHEDDPRRPADARRCWASWSRCTSTACSRRA